MRSHFLILLLFTIATSLAQQDDYTKYDLVSDLDSSLDCWSVFIFLPNSSHSISITNENISIHQKEKKCHRIKSNKEINRSIIELLKSQPDEKIYILGLNGYEEVDSRKEISGELIKAYVNFSFSSPCHNDDLFLLFTNSSKAKDFIAKLSNIFKEERCFTKLIRKIKT